MLAPRLPFSFDPLIAEAKQRMRRRRFLLAVLALIVAASILAFALWPSGGSPVGRPDPTRHSNQALGRLSVPPDNIERHWRTSVGSIKGRAIAPSTMRRLREHVLAVVSTTGATVVRMRIRRRTSPPAVELVIATDVRPAVFLRHRAIRFVRALQRPSYLRVVDTRGTSFFEWGGADGFGGFVGVPPRLQSCSPVSAWGLWGETPCPAK